MVHVGRCFCGEVQFQLSGEPVAMGYCHCSSCRQWSAGPVNAFTLWQPSALTVQRGATHIATFNKTPGSSRKWCTKCGGHLFTDHPAMGLVDVYAALLPTLRFEPALPAPAGQQAEVQGPAERDGRERRGGSGVTRPA